MKKIWKVAVIGCGSFACSQYFPNIAREANAVCVAAVDPVLQRAIEACERYGVPEHYTSVEELLANCDFDIAIDAANIQKHHKINMAVLQAGKHLISQKPAAASAEELTLQIEMAKEKKVKFSCVPIHPLRYDVNIAKQMMRDKTIGRPYYVKCNLSHGGPEYFQYRDADPEWFFQPGAGALVDMGVHGLQMVTALFGAAKRMGCMAKITTPRRQVRSGKYDGKVIEADKMPDHYVITLDFGEEGMAAVETGFSEKASRSPQLEIFGTEGTISFTEPYMTNPIPEVYMDCPERGIRGWIRPQEWTHPPKRLISQCCCLGDLVNAIEKDARPVLSAEHARHVLEIMCRIPEAIDSGKVLELKTAF